MDRLSAPLPYPSFKLPWGHVLDEICSLATSMLRLLVAKLSMRFNPKSIQYIEVHTVTFGTRAK